MRYIPLIMAGLFGLSCASGKQESPEDLKSSYIVKVESEVPYQVLDYDDDGSADLIRAGANSIF